MVPKFIYEFHFGPLTKTAAAILVYLSPSI